MKRLMMLVVGMSLPALAGYTYEIKDGNYWAGLSLNNTDSALVTGGGCIDLNVYEYSSLEIRNTAPLNLGYGGIWQIMAGGYSNINITGGEINQFNIGTYATAQISGGQINQIWSSYALPDSSRITLTCNPGYLLSYTNGVVTGISGTWLDGSNFNIRLVNPAGSSTVFSNMTIIPEPATMLLFAVGGMLIRRK